MVLKRNGPRLLQPPGQAGKRPARVSRPDADQTETGTTKAVLKTVPGLRLMQCMAWLGGRMYITHDLLITALGSNQDVPAGEGNHCDPCTAHHTEDGADGVKHDV